ncbi:MAG: hypothetical protein CM1200mP10_05970 [Candidatus Neomarinimicrobiota bacterium]|nr:MAG: hypothetical protein CM1200mP10_05970 [Candidatus Neomarinimicrobiota bacterium]
MPITTRKPAHPTLLQKFRSITEGYLLQVAQSEMVENIQIQDQVQHRRKVFFYKLLPILFLPGFRLTPWFIKNKLLRFFFVHPEQQWPKQPWEES